MALSPGVTARSVCKPATVKVAYPAPTLGAASGRLVRRRGRGSLVRSRAFVWSKRELERLHALSLRPRHQLPSDIVDVHVTPHSSTSICPRPKRIPTLSSGLHVSRECRPSSTSSHRISEYTDTPPPAPPPSPPLADFCDAHPNTCENVHSDETFPPLFEQVSTSNATSSPCAVAKPPLAPPLQPITTISSKMYHLSI